MSWFCIDPSAIFSLSGTRDLPMDESSFGVHQVKFVVESGEGFRDSRRIVQHANGPLDFGQVTTGNYRRGLVVDSHLHEEELTNRFKKFRRNSDVTYTVL